MRRELQSRQGTVLEFSGRCTRMLHILYKIKFDSASHLKVITVYLQTELCQNIWKEELMKSYFNYMNEIPKPKLSILENQS